MDNSQPAAPEWLTTDELATRWRCTVHHVSDEIRRGNLPAAKIGGRWLVAEDAATAYERAKMNVVPVRPARRRRRRPS